MRPRKLHLGDIGQYPLCRADKHSKVVQFAESTRLVTCEVCKLMFARNRLREAIEGSNMKVIETDPLDSRRLKVEIAGMLFNVELYNTRRTDAT